MSDKNLLLVKCIEKYPCLYNYNSNRYLKRDACDKAWHEVANATQLTVAECKEKWRNLRYGLLRSLKLNTDGSMRSKYYLHDEMEFILPFMRTAKDQEMLSHQVDVEIEDVTLNEQDNCHSPPQQYEIDFSELPMKKFKRQSHDSSNKHIQETEYVSNSQCNDDARKMFLLSLMPEVTVLTEYQMRLFRRKVLVLLDEIVDSPSQYQICHEITTDEETNNHLDAVIKTEP